MAETHKSEASRSSDTMTLPADPEKAGNVWCDACQQSLPAGRAATHLSSKRHQQNAEAAASGGEPKKSRSRGPNPRAEDTGETKPAASEKRGSKRAATPGGLIADPNKSGNYWCGICGVSLTPAKAGGHVATARHQENGKKTVTSAMRAYRGDGK